MKAKSIVENKFWIIEEEDGERIGTISLKNNCVNVNIRNVNETFSNFEELVSKYNVTFNNKKERKKKVEIEHEIYNFPTKDQPYNALWHLEMKLPIYTKTIKSNSYHCAGYYIIKFNTNWVKSFCPKLITLQRYEFKGPYDSRLEMMAQIRIHNGTK